MSSKAKQYTILLLVAFRWVSVLAQMPGSYTYEYYNSSHGLASSEIIALAKDSEGFLWVGTSAGLSRYDGYGFHNYSQSKDHELIGFVNAIVPDHKNRLWIGTDAGLFCYNNNEIVKISASSSLPQGINDILPEKDGYMWLATGNGPARIYVSDSLLSGAKKLAIADFVLERWALKNADIDTRRVMLIEKAADGTIYFSGLTALFQMEKDEILKIFSASSSRDQITWLLPVSNTKIYFNTIETDIHEIDHGVHRNIQHRFLYKPGVDDHLEGKWFQGTFGLYYFHPETAVVSRFVNTMEEGVLWPTAMLEDDNFFWVATYEGLIRLKPSIFTVYNMNSIFPKHRDYYSLLQTKNGELLLGSNRGNLLKKNDSGFSLLYEKIVPLSELKCLYEDERGWLWIGSGYEGMVLVRNNKRTLFTEKDGLHDNSFGQFLKTSDGRLYAIGDQGVTEIIVDANENISFRNYYYRPNITKHAKFLAAIEGPDKSIWIAGEEGLLHLTNDSLYPIALADQRFSIKDMTKDKNGNVWMATDGEGIWKCGFNGQNELNLLKQFTSKDGLPTLHYLGIMTDRDNNIWAGSSMGLTFIGQSEKHKNEILSFNESDGFLKPGYYFLRLYQERSGVIWAATSAGFTSFKPEELFLSTSSPEVHITAVRQIKTNEDIKDRNKENRFSYSNNSINFSFVAINYANQDGIRYFYKLEGLDTNWISAGNSRSVNYGNLPPNNYIFRVKSLNIKGRASQKDAVYSFTITAPFWKTWWFLLSAITILTLFAILLFRRRIAMIKTKADIQRQLMALEIRALRSQMNPHFIFNSLNSISQLVASKRNEEGLQYLSKFSKLLRLVLNQSEKSLIPLKDEILILDLYLQLETLRFGSSFSYTIHTDDSLDEEEILVPSFLMHPVIENAIWHGLLHKDGERRLIINFHGKDKDKLICIVKDNGIGIEAAALKKQQQLNGEKQPSKGLKMVKERLALLDEQNNGTTNFKLEDMKDDNGYISGTKCTIELPVIYE